MSSEPAAKAPKSALERIERRLLALADEAFDPEEAVDSDGYDQAERQGILIALDVVREELGPATDRLEAVPPPPPGLGVPETRG